MKDKFFDRNEAGRQLAAQIISYLDNQKIRDKGVVLGLARGGVVVAREVARALKWPLEVLIVKKVGAQYNPEYAVGAIAEGGVRIGERGETEEEEELRRRVEVYRGGRELPNLKNKIAIIVDDGLATGLTMKAAIASVKKLQPKKIVVAVPVAAKDTIEELRITNNELRVICVMKPDYLGAIGAFYENFEQVTDEEVVGLLSKANIHNLANSFSLRPI